MSTTSPEAKLLRWRRPVRAVALDVHRVKTLAPLVALLALTGALYLWGPTRNGYANRVGSRLLARLPAAGVGIALTRLFGSS
jgi:hypothetical protein